VAALDRPSETIRTPVPLVARRHKQGVKKDPTRPPQEAPSRSSCLRGDCQTTSQDAPARGVHAPLGQKASDMRSQTLALVEQGDETALRVASNGRRSPDREARSTRGQLHSY
jgi:hypothetical protein